MHRNRKQRLQLPILGSAVLWPLLATGGPQEALIVASDGATCGASIEQLAHLTISGGADGDRVGESVAISGETVVAGAPYASVDGEADRGAAFVFVEPSGGWTDMVQTATLTASDGDGGDHFGSTVDVDGDVILVAASGDDGSATDEGSVYVFVKPPGGWADAVETAKLTAADPAKGDEFGESAAVSGDTIVVGAPGKDIGFNANQGLAYVFVRPVGGWTSGTEIARLTASDGDGLDGAGQTIAIDGDVVLLGAPFNDVAGNGNQGSGYVYVRPSGGWTDSTETAVLSASDGLADDWLGVSSFIDGHTIVIGAVRDHIGANADQGSAYLYVEPTGGWSTMTETAKLTASDGAANDQLGGTVSVGGSVAAAGAHLDDESGSNRGSVYVFDRAAGGPARMESAKLLASDGAAGDEFGYSIAASGNSLAIGARYDDVGSAINQGSVYVARIVARPALETRAHLGASDGAAGDRLGESVAIHAGAVVAGAPYHDGGGAGDRGAAYVFVEPAGGWTHMTQTAKLTASDGAAGDHFGSTVDIDGEIILVAASGDDGAAADEGSVYVFVKPTGGWVDATETAKLTLSGAAGGDEFGESAAVSGNAIVVGAPGRDVGANPDQGEGYVFVKPPGGWATGTETAHLAASDGARGDEAGQTIAIDGDTVLLGAPFDDVSGRPDQGSGRVFVKPAGGWEDTFETATLTASDGLAGDWLGVSSCVDGSTIVIGAVRDDVDAKSNQGSAYVYVRPVGGWTTATEGARLTASDGAANDELGGTVAAGGGFAVAGAHLDDTSSSNVGSVYAFQRPAGGWSSGTNVAKLLSPDGAAGDEFGYSVDMAAPFVAIGARFDDNVGLVDRGSVYVASLAVQADCNMDGRVDAGDIAATVLEIFDGDGDDSSCASRGTYPGHGIGCDANGDGRIDAGDIACAILIIFDGPGACG